MLATQSEVHCPLTFQTGVAVVRCTTFGLYADGSFVVYFVIAFLFLVHILIQILERHAVTVFPVVAVVEDTFEGQFVVGVNIPVESCRIALAFAGDVVLADLVVCQAESSF